MLRFLQYFNLSQFNFNFVKWILHDFFYEKINRHFTYKLKLYELTQIGGTSIIGIIAHSEHDTRANISWVHGQVQFELVLF